MSADGLNKLLSNTKTSYLPVCVFAAVFFYYCSSVSFAPEQNYAWYTFFYICVVANIVFLLCTQTTKTLFWSIWLLIAGITDSKWQL